MNNIEIYTTYFAKLNKLPSDIVPISICGKAPNGYKGLQYKKLAPKWSFFSVWKETGDNEYYIHHFKNEVLSQLNPVGCVSELLNMVSDLNATKIALVCYEKPSDFCHRHLVAEWISENTNITVKEYNF
jgi:hypothetical protein